MTWVVFAISALLAGVGVFAILSGAPIIQVERGWTEVISGSVALSASAVVFSLGAVLMQLRRLQTFQGATTRFDPPADVPAVTDVPNVQGETGVGDPSTWIADVADPIDVEAVEERPPETRHGLWKRVRRSDETDPRAARAPEAVDRFETLIAPPPLAPVIDIDSGLPARSAEPLSQLAGAHTVVPEPRIADPAVGSAERLRSSMFGLRKSLQPETALGIPVAAAPAVERREVREVADVVDGAIDNRETVTATDVPEFASAEQSSTAELQRTVPAGEVTEVGRYQAGVASYVMYSDGTIHVETEGGNVHRFASMDELKAFIARQDQPAG